MVKRKTKSASKPIKSVKDVKRMIAYLEVSSDRFGKRNSILFQIGITTGFRAGDLVELTVGDVKEAIKKEEFIILENKKKNTKNIRKKNIKPRRVPVSKKLKSRLKAYIDDKEDYEYMFKSNKGDSHIEVDTISNLKKSRRIFRIILYNSSLYEEDICI